MRMFDMANDSDLFLTRQQLESGGAVREANCYVSGSAGYVPLYEAKMIWNFEHRWASDCGHIVNDGRPSRKYVGWYGVHYSDPFDLANGRYWVDRARVEERLGHDMPYVVAYRSIVNRDLERTSVFAAVPAYAVGHKAPVILFGTHTAKEVCCFLADRNSFISDFVTRNKQAGSDLTYFILKQLPILPPSEFADCCPWDEGQVLGDWVLQRTLELTYTAWDLSAFGTDCGYHGPPFRWDADRRLVVRCELDAAFFHLYGVQPEDVDYILETFPLVKRKDETVHGCYQTKDTILEIYDGMAEAIRTGKPHQSRLDPPPGPPLNADGTFAPLPVWQPGQPKPADWPSHIHPPRDIQAEVRPARVRPAAHRVQLGKAVACATTLLRTKSPLSREEFEIELALMLNDAVRKMILGLPPKQVATGAISVPVSIVRGMDGFLGGLKKNGVVTVDLVEGRQVIGVGDRAVARDKLAQADLDRAAEVMKAIEVVGLSPAISYYQEGAHEEFEFVR